MAIYERKLKTGKEWYVRLKWPATRHGRTIKERIGPGSDGKERAKIREAQILQDLRQGRDPAWRVIKPRLFEAVALEFLESHVGVKVEVVREDRTIKLRRRDGVQPVPLKKDADGFVFNVTVLLRHFDGKTLQAITPRVIQGFVSDRLRDGVTRGTVNRQRATLSTIFSWAIKQDPPMFGGENPVARVKKCPENPARERYLTPDEAAKLLDKMDDRFRILLLAALHTGARRGELLKVTWADLDLERRLITFRDTKNGSARTVPLSVTLTTAFKTLPRPIAGGPVFRTSDGAPLEPTMFRKAFEAAIKAAKLGDFRWHDLRHSAASFMVQAGVSLATVRAWLGHKSYGMTLRYAALAPDHLRDGADVMDRLASKAVDPGGLPVHSGARSGKLRPRGGKR